MKFRDTGAQGALLDEYERSIEELKDVISEITPMALTAIVDPLTEDSDCRSIQSILNHVISAGYSYVFQIRISKGESLKRPLKESYDDIEKYKTALDRMFQYNVKFFEDYSDIDLEDYETHRFTVSWGNQYDIEQLFEHAIVHILRHRRQIERFKLKLNY